MKCLILAAGYATRLYPLTENFPKPLLKVGDRTILDWLLADISSCSDADQYIVISSASAEECPKTAISALTTKSKLFTSSLNRIT